MHYHARMIELCSFLFGVGFSVLVYFRSIHSTNHPPLRKATYTILSTIGITDMVWLCGILIAHFLGKLGVLR